MGRKKGYKDPEKKKWMSKGTKSSMVFEHNWQIYLDNGWEFKHSTDTQKNMHKHWYNNGIEQTTIPDGKPIPEGYVKGMLPQPKGKYSKFEFKWYTNGIEQKRLSLIKGDIIPEGWWQGQSEEVAEKSRNASKGKKRTPEQIEHHKIGSQKAWKIKLANGTFNKSTPEDDFYAYLCQKFDIDDIIRNYVDENRYPWHCDFYIKSLDMFVELNLFPTHYIEPFDSNNQEHLNLLEKCKISPSNWVEKDLVKIWAGLDVRKKNKALENKLNFFALYNAKEIDKFKKFLDSY